MSLFLFKNKAKPVLNDFGILDSDPDIPQRNVSFIKPLFSTQMVDIGLTETVKEDPLKFGLRIQNKSEFYTLQVSYNNIFCLFVFSPSLNFSVGLMFFAISLYSYHLKCCFKYASHVVYRLKSYVTYCIFFVRLRHKM